MGTLEVTQNISPIRALEGEKRLISLEGKYILILAII